MRFEREGVQPNALLPTECESRRTLGVRRGGWPRLSRNPAESISPSAQGRTKELEDIAGNIQDEGLNTNRVSLILP